MNNNNTSSTFNPREKVKKLIETPKMMPKALVKVIKPNPKPTFYFSKLPSDIYHIILRLIGSQALATLKRLNKEFNQIIMSKRVSLQFKKEDISIHKLNKFVK